MNKRLFFESTQSVTENLAELMNFLFPAWVGLWNLRKEVNNFVATSGKYDQHAINLRFVTGSGVTSADLQAACVTSTWDENQEKFAKFHLFELCGLYESWLEDVVPRSAPKPSVEKIQKALQFPDSAKGNGVTWAVGEVNKNPSIVLQSEFLPVLVTHPKNSWGNIQELLIAYRYFKECRNAFIHRGGIANQYAVDAFTDFISVPISRIGLREKIQAQPVVLGSRISVAPRDVLGFGNIVHRLIVTLDAALAVSIEAENDMLNRVRQHLPGPFVVPPVDAKKRAGRVRSMVSKAGLPKPVSVTHLDKLFQTKRLIKLG